VRLIGQAGGGGHLRQRLAGGNAPLGLEQAQRHQHLLRRGVVLAAKAAQEMEGAQARGGGQLVELSAREIGLLEIFLLRVGRLVSKDQLVDHLCGWGEEVSSNAIEVYVHRLRKKLEDSGVRIVTVRGLGYCLENPDAAPAAKVQA